MIRVMLADDHEVVRAGFRMILEQDPDVRVVAEAADGAQAYAVVAREKPDILLMDISMPPGQSGLVACEKIAKDFPARRWSSSRCSPSPSTCSTRCAGELRATC
jgi:two-component system, NarL family, response regulator NreC